MNILRTLTPGLFITLQVKAFSKSFYLQFSVGSKKTLSQFKKKKEVMISKVGCFTQGQQIMGSQNLGNIFCPSAPAKT